MKATPRREAGRGGILLLSPARTRLCGKCCKKRLADKGVDEGGSSQRLGSRN